MKYDVDFERVALLLMIPEKVASVAPSLTNLSSAAMAELKEINDQVAGEMKAEAQAKEAEAAQAVAAKQKALSAAEPEPVEVVAEPEEPEDDQPPRRV